MFKLIQRFLKFIFKRKCPYCGHYVEIFVDREYPYEMSNSYYEYFFFACDQDAIKGNCYCYGVCEIDEEWTEWANAWGWYL